MSSGNGFGERFTRTTNGDTQIHIDDNNGTLLSPAPANHTNNNLNIPMMAQEMNNGTPSSSLHTMLNRMRNFGNASSTIGGNTNSDSWRMNLNDVLSFSRSPTSQTLRSLISHSGSFRYTPLATTNDGASDSPNIHIHSNNETPNTEVDNNSETNNGSSGSVTITTPSIRIRGASLRPELTNIRQINQIPTLSTANAAPIDDIRPEIDGFRAVNTGANAEPYPPVPHARLDDDNNNNNVFSDIFVRLLGHFVRYLPFLAILFVKFIHDHLLGLLDLISLQGAMYFVNKSLCSQVAKFSQKSYSILLRDFGLISMMLAYRLLLTTSPPDPFGLLITPPAESLTIVVSAAFQPPNVGNSELNGSGGGQQPPSAALTVLHRYLSILNSKNPTNELEVGNTVTVTKAISLGLLFYYVAVNDLFLKMLTILTKIFITMLPTRLLRHKQRARMYVLIEYLSQFYRSCAPVRQWIIFLFKSYTGLEVISGILFSAFYMGAKGFEFMNRGKMLRGAFVNFIRNMDYERKPTKDELNAAGQLCPICYDAYKVPVILTCSHIFCDDCVSQWFKREQTCPLCRAKVNDDPQFTDGSTTYFFQLC